MRSEIELLRADPALATLLDHYARQGGEAWSPRVAALDGSDPRRLTRLHGELLAHGLIEMDTGKGGYRPTAAGLKANSAGG